MKIASTIVNEYREFKIIELMQEASTAAANRPNWNDNQYIRAVSDIRRKADEIKNKTVFNTLFLDIADEIEKSDIGVYMPQKLANMLLLGMPTSKHSGISSGEIGMYVNGGTQLVSSLNAMITTARSLNVEEYKVDEKKIGLDILIPRPLAGNGAILLSKKAYKVSEWLQHIDEICSGSRADPEIVCISTTDPIFTLAFIPATAYAGLHFYKLLLEVAEKHLNIIKMVRDLKKPGLPQIDLAKFEEDTRKVIEASVSDAVSKAIANMKSDIDASRLNEIRPSIEKTSLALVDDICGGMRISLCIESGESISEHSGKDSAVYTEIKKSIAQQNEIEIRLGQVFAMLEDHLLLTNRNAHDEKLLS